METYPAHARCRPGYRRRRVKTSARTPRVVITGSESTGKTTLAAHLAAALGTIWIPEYSRTFAETRGNSLSAATVEPIALGQIEAEDAAESGDHELLVLDTDLVSTTVYAEHYYGSCPPWIMTAALERLGDLYLLGDIDLPWQADTVRDQPASRAVVQQRFVDRLDELGARVARVSGTGAGRLSNALDHVAAWQRSMS